MNLQNLPTDSSNFKMVNGCIKATVSAYEPYTIYNGTHYYGPCIYIFDLIMKKLGFCYELVTEGKWGSRTGNGSWSGMIGVLQRHEAEIAMCPFAMNHPRFQVVDYSEIIIPSDYIILYPRPQLESNQAGFLMPFSWQAWVLIVASYLFLTMISFVWSKVAEQAKTIPEWMMSMTRNWSTFLHHYWNMPYTWAYGAILAQPTLSLPRSYGGRVFVCMWFFIAVIFGLLYKCNLKALLIVPKVQVPFNDLKGLIEYGKFEWSFLKHSVLELYFEPAYHEDPNSVMGQAWSGRGELYLSAKQIVPFVTERGMACISITHKVIHDLAKDFSETGKCRMAISSETLIPSNLMYAFPKHSLLPKMMNPYLMSMNEFGLLSRYIDAGMENATYCKVPPGKEIGIFNRALKLEDFYGSILLWAAGLFLAFVIFLGEHAHTRFIGNAKQRRY